MNKIKFDTVEVNITKQQELDYITLYIKELVDDASFEQFSIILDETNSLEKACKAAILNAFVIKAIEDQIAREEYAEKIILEPTEKE